MTDDLDRPLRPATEPRANFTVLKGGRPPEDEGEDILVAVAATVGVRLCTGTTSAGQHPRGPGAVASLVLGLSGGGGGTHFVCVHDDTDAELVSVDPLGLRLQVHGDDAVDDLIATLIELGERLKPIARRRPRQ